MTDTVRIVFASCQYPPGLLDGDLAYASYARLNHRLSQANSPTLLLLLGDQIYSDATAGLQDPVQSAERYDQRYRDWLGQPHVRAIMQNPLLSVQCMPDDHELVDNWEPLCKTSPNNALNEWYKQRGLKAFWRYQRGVTAAPAAGYGPIWQQFQHQGYAFFMMDTRTQRAQRDHRNIRASTTLILDDLAHAPQTTALEAWLLEQHRLTPHKPKLLSSASMLFPRRTANETDVLSMDSWQGYPSSFHRLLAFIAQHQIQKVVFLSGDEHLASIATLTVNTVKPLKVYSIHCPALYAPLAFANADAADFLGVDSFNIRNGPINYPATIDTVFPPTGNGYVELAITDDAMTVTVDLDSGNWSQTISI